MIKHTSKYINKEERNKQIGIKKILIVSVNTDAIGEWHYTSCANVQRSY